MNHGQSRHAHGVYLSFSVVKRTKSVTVQLHRLPYTLQLRPMQYDDSRCTVLQYVEPTTGVVQYYVYHVDSATLTREHGSMELHNVRIERSHGHAVIGVWSWTK